MVIVAIYDIATDTAEGAARLRKAAKICLNWGHRIQNSVYECDVNEDQYRRMRTELCSCINPVSDRLRFYRLGKHWRERIECFGIGAGQSTEVYVI